MHRILLITDNEPGFKKIKSGLTAKGYKVLCLSFGDVLSPEHPLEKLDILLIEILESSNFPFIRRLKKDGQFKGVPSIALTKEEFLQGIELSLNIDDFICSPYSVEEIEFRIRLILWRLNRVDVVDILRFGDLTIDFAKYEVKFKGDIVDLAYKEYELLKFLATHPDKVLTREMLLDKVWGYNYYGGTRTVDVHIRHLRSKIEDEKHRYIETVRNVGYRFKEK